jgi:hypothetical protein
MSNTEQFIGIAQRSQHATTKAIQVWTDAVKSYADNISVEHPLPRPAEMHTVVNGWFDLAGQLLAEQRNYAKTLIDAGLEAAGTAADQARSVAEQAHAAAVSVPQEFVTKVNEAYASAGAPKRTRAARNTDS